MFPVCRSADPSTSSRTALTTQIPTPEVVRGTGGPKKQLASRSHDPVVPLGQPLSVRHASAPVPFTQCLPGPPPSVQSAGPVPGSGPMMTVEPEIAVTAVTDVPPSGTAKPATGVVGEPPPEYWQPRPRSARLLPSG